MKIDQTVQASAFSTENQDKIASVRNCLSTEIRRFLDSPQSCIPLVTKVMILSSLDQGNLDLACSKLRLCAADLAPERTERDRYWTLVDCYSFLSDAIGTQWPYMTLAHRAAALQFAVNNLNDLPVNPDFERDAQPRDAASPSRAPAPRSA